MEKNVLKGALLVGLGASSYGALATVVKLAYQHGFTTAEVTTSQFSIGFAGLLLLNLLLKKPAAASAIIHPNSGNNRNAIFKLMLGGTSLAFTSICYYFSVKYIPVSVAIVLLMQSVWIGLLLEAVLDKKWPSVKKLVATAIVLLGTALATNIFSGLEDLNWKGLAWGFAAGLSYTISMLSTNQIATHMPSSRRSLWMLAGGLIVALIFLSTTDFQHFNFGIFWPWGLFLAFFGTILPPLLFTSGMPHTGIGLGTIIAAIELPISVMFAYLLLREPVNLFQLLGIFMIITAIVLMNVQTGSKKSITTA